MVALPPCTCLQQLETCHGADKAEKTKQGVSLDQVKHSLQLPGANFKSTEQLIAIYADVKESLNCLRATNRETEKLRLRHEPGASPTGNCCTKIRRLCI